MWTMRAWKPRRSVVLIALVQLSAILTLQVDGGPSGAEDVPPTPEQRMIRRGPIAYWPISSLATAGQDAVGDSDLVDSQYSGGSFHPGWLTETEGPSGPGSKALHVEPSGSTPRAPALSSGYSPSVTAPAGDVITVEGWVRFDHPYSSRVVLAGRGDGVSLTTAYTGANYVPPPAEADTWLGAARATTLVAAYDADHEWHKVSIEKHGYVSSMRIDTRLVQMRLNDSTELIDFGDEIAVDIGGFDGVGGFGGDIARFAIFDRSVTEGEGLADFCATVVEAGDDERCEEAVDASRDNFALDAPILIGEAGDPVDTSSGTLIERTTDLAAPSDVYGLDLMRTYTSREAEGGVFGERVSSVFDATAFDLGIGVYLRLPSGRGVWMPSSGGGFAGPPSFPASAVVGSGGGITLTQSTGEEWVFDAVGRLIEMSDGQGQEVVLTRRSDGFPTRIESSNSGQPGWYFHLVDSDDDRLVDRISGPVPAGSAVGSAPTVSYEYDGSLLSRVSRPHLATSSPVAWRTYGYGIAGDLTSVVDDVGTGKPDVVALGVEYHPDGRVYRQTMPAGEQLTFTYGSPDAAGASATTVTHTGAGRAETLTYHHGADRRLTAITDPFGKVMSQEIVDDRLAGHTDRTGASHTQAYDTSTGLPTSYTRPNPTTGAASDPGGSTTYCPGGSRQLHVVHADGTTTDFEWGSPGQTGFPCVAGVTKPTRAVRGDATPEAASWSFGYDGNLLSGSTDPDGVGSTLHWDVGRRLLLSSSDDPGTGPRTTYYGYDEAGRLRVTRSPGGIERWSEYAPDGQVTRSVGPTLVASRTCAPATGCAWPATPPSGATVPVESFTYWDDGTAKTSVDAKVKTTNHDVTYPASGGRVETTTRPARSTTVAIRSFDRTTYDALGDVKRSETGGIRVSDGVEVDVSATTYAYDPTYGLLHRVSSVTGPPTCSTPATCPGVVTRYHYDDEGRVDQTTVGASLGTPASTWTTAYDKRGRTTDEWGPQDPSPGAPGRSHTRYVYDGADRVTEVVEGDAAGSKLRTRSSYDDLGRLSRKTVDRNADGVAGDPTDHITEYGYSAAGRMIDSWESPVDVASFAWNRSDPAVLHTHWAFDDAGQAVITTDPAGNATTQTFTPDSQPKRTTLPGGYWTEAGYDAFGNIASRTTPSPTGTGEVVATATYDVADRLTASTEAHDPALSGAATTRTWTNDGLLATVVNPKGGANNTVSYGYDARANRTTRTSKANNDPAALSTYVTATETWELSPSNQVTRFRRPSESAAPGTKPGTRFGYDPATGRLATRTEPSGRLTTYATWASGLAKTTTSALVGQPTVTVDETHDDRGRRTSRVDATGTSTFAWSRTGQLISASLPPTAANPTPNYSYGYDLAGRATSITYPDATKHLVEHDRLGRTGLVKVEWWPGASWPLAHYQYDLNGNRTAETVNWSEGSRTWAYPANGSPYPTTYTQTLTQGGTLGNRTTALTWKADGRLATEATAGTTMTYAYDTAGQLTSRSGGGSTLTSTYSSHGSRLTSKVGSVVTTNTFDIDDQTVSSVTGTATTTYAWDADGRRTSVVTPTSTRTTTYDARGLPVSVQNGTGGALEARTYDGDGQLTRYVDSGTGASAELVWDRAQAIPQTLETRYNGSLWTRSNRGLELLGVHFNTVGNATFYGFDAQRDVIRTDNYATAPTGYTPHGVPSGTGLPILYSGYRSELHLGPLLHLRNRDYDPVTGTFTTRDPVDGQDGTPTEANPYHYVDNDPMNKVDPLGLSPDDLIMDPCSGSRDFKYKVRDGFAGYLKAFGLVRVVHAANGPGELYCSDDLYANIGDAASTGVPIMDCANILFKGARDFWSYAGCAFDAAPIVGQIAGALITAGRVAMATDDVAEAGKIISHADDLPDAAPHPTPDKPLLPHPCSFNGETPVLMGDGTTKEIADIRKGDMVLASDPITGETGGREVTFVFPHTDQLLTLRTDSGAVVTTEDHKYWNHSDQEWQESQDLDNGDGLLTADGESVIVQGLDWSTAHTGAAYDLSVADLHTYYVGIGEKNVLVHNCFDVNALSTSGRAADKGGLTRAGRAYQKHMGRGELPHVGGAQLDSIGQSLLDDILTAPGKRIVEVTSGRFAGGVRYIRRDGRSATFDSSGIFQYFGVGY
jgi:RHS repeat-associated protein